VEHARENLEKLKKENLELLNHKNAMLDQMKQLHQIDEQLTGQKNNTIKELQDTQDDLQLEKKALEATIERKNLLTQLL
jgi:hypothetical protein